MTKGTVFVGLSGGVDSSVAAYLLRQTGYDVVGVFIKVWQPDFLTCNWERERLDAMRVAAHLDIPFLTLDAEETYKKEVAKYMLTEYKEGRTPNPDVMCNQHVKFGAFLDYAKTHGADKVATGHYARIEKASGVYKLFRGIDSEKDQSYFLWTLGKEQLSRVLFPVGDMKKEELRKEAKACGIPVANKTDSQGICFLGQVDMKAFLSHYVHPETGDVLNENGQVIGEHDGAIFYTVGQRHGFRIHTETKHSEPHYVIGKDIATNTLTVSTHPRTTGDGRIKLTSINCLRDPCSGEYTAQFRYRQKPFAVRVEESSGQCAMLTVLAHNVEMPSAGQSCVLYDEDECVGGGIIEMNPTYARNQS